MDKKKLKENTIQILRGIATHIENENYEKVEDYLAYSPRGDGYGQDNYYIDFGTDVLETDISETISILKSK